MNGFTMQQTDFPFVCVIVDDASTDGEPAVIQKYLDCNFDLQDKSVVRNEETDDYVLTFAQHKTNKNCYFAAFILKYNHYSCPELKECKFRYIEEWYDNAKYLAICEGDDFWINTCKLQKQVDFLEEHNDFCMVCSKAKVLYGDKLLGVSGTSDTSFEGLLSYSNFPTLTRLYRRSIEDEYMREIQPFSNTWMMGDYPRAFYYILKSKVKFLDEVFAVYRILDESASHSKDISYLFRFYDSADCVRRFFVNKFIFDKDKRDKYERLIKKNEVEYKISMLLSRKEKLKARKILDEQGNSLTAIRRLKFKIMLSSYLLYKVVVVSQIVVNKLNRICPLKH
jgi:glycosyltransferase involved in cell wall biosynthesis